MKKEAFLRALDKRLEGMSAEERARALEFCAESIDDRVEDGMSEADAVAALGPVGAIAAQIIAETPVIPKAIAKANTGSRTLNVVLLKRGMAWLDTGSPKGMLQAAEFVETIQERQGFYVSCIEEIAWRRGFINTQQLLELGEELYMTDYGQYLIEIAKGER